MAQNARAFNAIALCGRLDPKLFYFVLKKILAVPLGASLAYENTKVGGFLLYNPHLSPKDNADCSHNEVTGIGLILLL